MRKIRSSIFLALVLTLVIGLPGVIQAHNQQKAGFYTLEQSNFYFHSQSYFKRIALRSSETRIWYTYQPADEDPASKPLIVFYNGGPGGATSSGLFCANTGRLAVNYDHIPGTGTIVNNPSSWTKIGNLLHIDSRTAGFSYSLMDNPQENTLRKAEFEGQNYNAFIDATDFARVILRFLRDHPEIQKNPVILVPESYGGIRTTVILHLLLYYKKYENGEKVFQNQSLIQEIQNHYNAVFPEYSGQTVPPDVIARQFGHQVMIQVAVSHPNQRQIAIEMLEAANSPIYQLAAETGVPYIRWREQPGNTGTPQTNWVMNNIYDYLDMINRDPYIFSKPGNYFNGFLAASEDLLTRYTSLSRLIGMDPAGIPELYSTARQNGYKSRDTDTANTAAPVSTLLGPLPKTQVSSLSPSSLLEGDLASVFGTLQPWDRFFIDLNRDANIAFVYNRLYFSGYRGEMYWAQSHRFGEMFLENAAWVNTFITNAAYDVVVFSPAFPSALAKHTDYLSSVQHDTDGPPGATRPGQMKLNYLSSSVPGSNVTQRTIRFPYYSNSGHAVTLTEPAEMLSDVIEWLRNTGIFVNSGGGLNR
ncbi:hypothetical protein ACFLT9_08135 [Acidobacteriota bacterium]